MPTHFNIMPVDKSTIHTRLRIHPDLWDDPAEFVSLRDLKVRTLKPTRGRSSHGPTMHLKVDLLTYKGVHLNLTKVSGDPLTNATIDFNPGVCLYGHNGRIADLPEFLDALSILATHFRQLLETPDDWLDIVPGLRSGGAAYWAYLEVPFQCQDPDGSILAAFRNLRHPDMRKLPRHWPTSIEAGGKRSELRLSIYRKAVEMVAHGKFDAVATDDRRNSLRFEARMKGKKLTDYFGAGDRNVEMIDGTERLTSFFPEDLVRGLRRSFGELEGVYASEHRGETECKSKPLASIGQMLAEVALHPRTRQTFHELLAQLRFYIEPSWSTVDGIRKAGLAALARRSSITRDVLFSDDTFRTLSHIPSESCEKKVRHDIEDTAMAGKIAAAYRPRDQPFRPITRFRSYLDL